MRYHRTDGPLREIARDAAADPSRPYVLIVDEINRGNIPKIFGELLFLLEYRQKGVRLQYWPEQEFTLPANLFVIGTMNTADRCQQGDDGTCGNQRPYAGYGQRSDARQPAHDAAHHGNYQRDEFADMTPEEADEKRALLESQLAEKQAAKEAAMKKKEGGA